MEYVGLVLMFLFLGGVHMELYESKVIAVAMNEVGYLEKATNALRNGMPVQCLQKILGHHSLDTTMIYCNVDDDTVRYEHCKVA